MGHYLPSTEAERQEMLSRLGLSSVRDLYRDIPESVWLDRPPELLAPTEDRPLAATREAILARYRERLPRYRSTCDVRIDSAGTPADAAALILADRRI